MHRTFAGILGTTAFATSVVHGWLLGVGASAAIGRAALALAAFALLGAVAGYIAEATVEEGVSRRLHEALSNKTKR